MSRDTRFYDERNAAAHAAVLHWSDAHLTIDPAGGASTVWPRASLNVGAPDPDGMVALTCDGQAGRVLTDAAGLPATVRAQRGWRAWHAAAWTVAGVAMLMLAFVIVVRLPSVGVALVPRSAEDRLGAVVQSTIVGRHKVCRGVDGQHALEQLEARLSTAAGVTQPVQLVVIDSAAINALTLPGARMVVMRGLIDKVGGADQLAGVMAHETGHIARRDPLTALLRSAGIGLIGTVFGIHVGFADVSSLAGRLVGLSYSRDMERAADANGVAYLRASGLRSDGLAAFFAMMEKRDGSVSPAVEFLSDHPRTREREWQNQGSAQGASALTAQQWAAVRGMCGKS